MDKQKFQEVLFKIHECEAFNELKYKNANSEFVDQCKFKVFQETKVDSNLFYSTLDYYKKHTEEFEAIYDTLIYQSESKIIP